MGKIDFVYHSKKTIHNSFFTIIIHISVPKQYADTLDFKEMLIRILCNKPPSYEELLKPKDYYRRISSWYIKIYEKQFSEILKKILGKIFGVCLL